MLLPRDYIQIAEIDGEAASFVVLLPNINEAIADLEISKNGMILYAATSGEGVFRYQKRPVSH